MFAPSPGYALATSTPVDGLGAPIPDFDSRTPTPTSAFPHPRPDSYARTPLLSNLAPDLPPALPTATASEFTFLPPGEITESPQGIPQGELVEEQPVRPPLAARTGSLPAYSALDPYATFGSSSTDGPGYGVGLSGIPPTITEKTESMLEEETGSEGSSSRDYGTSFRSRVEEGDLEREMGGGGDGEDVSIIGSGADDLRPNGVPLGEVDVDGGGMVNPARKPGISLDHNVVESLHLPNPHEASFTLEVPRSEPASANRSPAQAPSPAAPSPAANPANDANWPSSRNSVLLKVPPQTLVSLLVRAEQEYDSMQSLYTQAVAEAGVARHQLGLEKQKWENKVRDAEERFRDSEERRKEAEAKSRERGEVIVSLEKQKKDRDRDIRSHKKSLAETERMVEKERELRKVRESEGKRLETVLEGVRGKVVQLEGVVREREERIREVEFERDDVRAMLTEELELSKKAMNDLASEHTKLKLETEQERSECARAKADVRELEEQLQEAKEEAAKARSSARRMRAEVLGHLAKEEGRREGWEEGMKRGKGMAEALAFGVGIGAGVGQQRLVGDGMAYIEEVSPVDRDRGIGEDEEERRRREKKRKGKEREKQKERERQLELEKTREEEEHLREKSELLARLAELENSIAAERSKSMNLLAQKDRATSEIGSVVERVYELEGRLERERAERQRELERERSAREMELERLKEEERRKEERLEREKEREVDRVREEEKKRAEEEISKVKREKDKEREEEEERERRRRRERDREVEEEEERLRRRRRELEEEDMERTRKAAEEGNEAAKKEREQREEKEKEAKALREELEKAKEERERLKGELATAKTPQITLSYLPMPPPPQPAASTSNAGFVPPGVPSSLGSSRRGKGKRRDRVDSGSDTASDLGALDILNMPGFDNDRDRDRDYRNSDRDRRRRERERERERVAGLGTIHEMPSFSASPSMGGPMRMPSPSMGGGMRMPSPGGGAPPSWVNAPPPNLAHGGSSYGNPMMQMPQPDLLSPPDGRPALKKMGSGSTSGSSYGFHVEPPSRPGSSMQQGPTMPQPYGQPQTFLSPTAHGGSALPHQPRNQGFYGRPPSAAGGDTRPNSPYSVPGGLPAGFIPQNMTPSAPSGIGMPAPIVNGENMEEKAARRARRDRERYGGATSSMRPDAGRGMPQPESSIRPGGGVGMPEPPSSSMRPDAGRGMPQPESSMRPGAGYGMPDPNSAGAVTSPLSGGVGGVSFPEPTVPMYTGVPRAQSSLGTRTPGGYGSARQTPASAVGGGVLSMPEPTVPGGRTPRSGGATPAIGFPEPIVPNIVPQGSRTPASGAPMSFPEPGVPQIIPSAGIRTPGGHAPITFPEPNVPSFAPSPGPAPSAVLGGRARKSTMRKEKTTKKGGMSMPEPSVPSFAPSPGPGAPLSMPEPNVLNYTGVGGAGTGPSGLETPPSGFPPVIPPMPSMPGGMGSSPMMGSVGMPQPTVVDYTGGSRTPISAGVGMPTPTVSGVPLGAERPVIPGVTTTIGGRDGDEGPFIPPSDVLSRAESRTSNGPGGGNGGGLFGSLGSAIGGGWGWGGSSSNVNNGNGNGNDDRDDDGGGDDGFGGGGGGFIPPSMRDAEEDDDLDSTTMRNTRANANLVANEAPGKKKKKGTKKR
ncbi:hypothetical protein DFP72DRAFT_920388 [Ephemerocybe angulata]|uniref:Uncharacterized protein n=1 Tax=Ephemerocybe angulata TaxID=980116 RepID=A0A8H6HHS2_9AGAR|nr:hypothetical protein DFP72DRAFT_920388 [Tulosesus angulatus]